MPDLHPTPGPWGIEGGAIQPLDSAGDDNLVLYIDGEGCSEYDEWLTVENPDNARVIAYASVLYERLKALVASAEIVDCILYNHVNEIIAATPRATEEEKAISSFMSGLSEAKALIEEMEKGEEPTDA